MISAGCKGRRVQPVLYFALFFVCFWTEISGAHITVVIMFLFLLDVMQFKSMATELIFLL